MVNKINIEEKLGLINDYWNPRIIGELNGQHIKLAKLKGEFIWHKHIEEDEMFLVISGKLIIAFRDKNIELLPNEFCIIPKGIEHRPIANEEVSIMLFEPISTLNTGDIQNEFTKASLTNI